MNDTILIPITPADGWDTWENGAVGYYIHKEVAYLDGALQSDGITASTRLLLTVPTEVAPTSNQHFTVYCIRGLLEGVDSALVLPTTFAVTLNTDGTLTLDDDPAVQVNVAPSVTDYWYFDGSSNLPRYVFPINLGLVIGDLSWQLPSPSTSDTFITASLAAYMAGGDFTNIDAGYVAHGSRVHLTGSVHAAIDGASKLFTSMPSDAIGGINTDGGDVTRAPDGRAISVFTDSAFFDTTAVKPAGQPHYIKPYLPEELVRGATAGDANWSTSTITDPTDTSLPPRIGGITIGDFGPYDGRTVGTEYTCSDTTCRAAGDYAGSVTMDLDLVLSTLQPTPPDWYTIFVLVAISGHTFGTLGCGTGENDPCGEYVDPDFSTTINFGTAGTDHLYFALIDGTTLITPDPGVGSPFGSQDAGGLNGAFLAPGTDIAMYEGDTGWRDPDIGHNLPGPLLWKGNQVSGTVTVTYSATLYSAAIHVRMFMTPYWEVPQDGYFSGDTVSLEGSGWPGVVVIPPVTPEITVGPSSTGIVQLG